MIQLRHFLLFLLLSFGLLSCKKDLLHWQSAQALYSGTTDRLNRILFINDTLGFIAGGERFDNADVLITHDGGHTWQYHSFPEIGKGLYAVAGRPDGHIYITGFEGKLLQSADFGATWTITTQRYDAYKAMALTATGKLLMAGGISYNYGFIEHADADGTHPTQDSFDFELNDIALQPGGTGYATGYGAILKTTGNGAVWTRQEPGTDNFKSLFMMSPTEVWLCGYNGSIYHTTDGGAHWERKRNGNELTIPRYHLETILFTDALHGYAAGEQGAVIYTDDGGGHWSEFDRFTSETLHSIALCPDGELLVCGDHGVLYRLQKK